MRRSTSTRFTIPVDNESPSTATSSNAASFSRLLGAIPVRIVSLRTAAVGKRPPFDIAVFAPRADNSLEKASRGRRPVWFAAGWCDTAIWSRRDLPVGAVIEGPAILEQSDATIVVEPGLRGRVDRLGNIILERGP